MKKVINRAPGFASLVDANCEVCRAGKEKDNSRQIQTLRQRAKEFPNEKKAIERLVPRCRACQESDNSNYTTITQQYSCIWRVGI